MSDKTVEMYYLRAVRRMLTVMVVGRGLRPIVRRLSLGWRLVAVVVWVYAALEWMFRPIKHVGGS